MTHDRMVYWLRALATSMCYGMAIFAGLFLFVALLGFAGSMGRLG